MSLSIEMLAPDGSVNRKLHVPPAIMPDGSTIISSREIVRTNKLVEPFVSKNRTANVEAMYTGGRIGEYELRITATDLKDFREARELALCQLGVEVVNLKGEILAKALEAQKSLRKRIRWLLTGKLD